MEVCILTCRYCQFLLTLADIVIIYIFFLLLLYAAALAERQRHANQGRRNEGDHAADPAVLFVLRQLTLLLLLLLVVVTVNKPIKTECARTSRRRSFIITTGEWGEVMVCMDPAALLPSRGLLIQRRKASATLFFYEFSIDVFFFSLRILFCL